MSLKSPAPFHSRSLRYCGLLLFTLAFISAAWAFSPPEDKAGPLTMRIADPGEVQALNKSIAVPVTITNSGDEAMSGEVRVSLTDDWKVEGKDRLSFSIGPKAEQVLPFSVTAGSGSYAALYPVHAHATFRVAQKAPLTAHAVLIVSVSKEALIAAKPEATRLKALRAPTYGGLRLDAEPDYQPSIAIHDRPIVAKPVGWQGSDKESGGSIGQADEDRGGRRHAFSVHPPYRGGWGDALIDYRIALPNKKPITLGFATAIRDQAKDEPASDGVDFRVQVRNGHGEFKEVFARFSAAKQWETATVDLSAYAGREVTLRLFTGPGPKHNTVCDSAFWAEPLVWVGSKPKIEPEAERAARRQTAIAAAQAALAGKTAEWSWKLESEAGTTGAAVVSGPQGIADAFFAFVDGKRELVFEGFVMAVDGLELTPGKPGLVCQSVERRFKCGRGVLVHQVWHNEKVVPAQTEIWAEKGALRVGFSMPGVKRDDLGEPRFTKLMLGQASDKARRVVAGFGNVLEAPGKFELRGGGFTLSTRHVGVEFGNGVSLLQATDIFPDSFSVDGDTRRYALAAHHDTTFSFLPTTQNLFAAARAYRAIAAFQPAGGVGKLQGKMCLDQWGGDYREAAEGIANAARYGLTDAVFVKHDWQRWGYDYRLPDIYPPSRNAEDFKALADACHRNGILFCPHDNYIDYYPDAEGFSYDHILFNKDGTPQTAWFNKGRQALSYRWLPTAFFPWLDRNLKLVKDGFAPTSYFVDVFSAIPPIDFYDRAGRFYSKMVCGERWGAAFDQIRTTLGNNAPTISEAGHDALIGHLDGSQSDHSGWCPDHTSHFNWNMAAGDAERVPWHDMASHGAFVLFAGGLGPRYAGERGDDPLLHGYGSDDYLSMTVLGGRNPMCDGPFSRRAVMTYWLLHDVCAVLARSEMTAHEFNGDNIHRQTSRFGRDAIVHANRGKEDWEVAEVTLPPYGFIARVNGIEASVTRRDGIITAFAQHGPAYFIDARPEAAEERGLAQPRVLAVEDRGNRSFRLKMEWLIKQPVEAGYRPFMHFAKNEGSSHEDIAFQGHMKFCGDLAKPGMIEATCDATLPPDIKLPVKLAIRPGLYHPTRGGERPRLAGPIDRTGRARCGDLEFGTSGVTWQSEPIDQDVATRELRLNLGNMVVDFGVAATNGAFQLRCDKDDIELTPLPSSSAFDAELRLDRLGFSGRRVVQMSTIDSDGEIAARVPVKQEGETLRLHLDAQALRYRLEFQQTDATLERKLLVEP